MRDQWWKDKSAENQHAADSRDLKTFYSLLSEIYGPRSSSITPLRSKDGSRLLSKPEDIRDRWREHFNELLNRPSNIDNGFIDQLDQFPIKDELDNQPTMYEVYRVVAQMNRRKAPWTGQN